MTEASDTDELSRRERILLAAFGLFMERGYAGTSTLAIASAAKVSKRDLYADFAGNERLRMRAIAAELRRRGRNLPRGF